MTETATRGSDLSSEYPTLMKYSAPLKAAERKIVGRENEIAQLMAALSRPELCNALLLAPAGSGKLLPLGTPIPTPTGWTTMGELEVGDYVLGQDGKPAPVIFTSDVEQTPELFELTFSDGRTEIACVDHQWLVSDENQRDRSTPSGRAEFAERLRVNTARREGYLALAAAADEDDYVTVHELLPMIEAVPGATWSTPVSLLTFLTNAGVKCRAAVREQVQAWKGTTRDTTVHVTELNVQSAMLILADQARRQFSEIGDESVLTTGMMIERGVNGSGGRSRFAIRVAAPLELPAQELIVDPYVMGAWLGDGHTRKQVAAEITSADQEIIDEVINAGYVLRNVKMISPKNKAKDFVFDGLGADLTVAGIGEAKRIPMQYLRASFEQRLALLQGIMDTDGSISENGGCELTLSDADLAADVEELIHTLGIKVSRRVGKAGYKNAAGEFVQCKDRHRMTFTTSLPVFRMVRKAIRVPAEVRSTQRLLYITDIKPVESRPGKCIQVGNADSMYLCGRGFVPTHNTALVQGTMLADKDRTYREVDLAKMIAELSNVDEMASRLKALFDEAEEYRVEQGHDLVLFIDEFHQIVQLSPAAVEALKPILAASGARGIRVIAATTFDEFRQHISPNQPLVERLQRINLAEPDRKTTVSILKGMAERYDVANQFYDDHMFELIYEFTNRYVPASSQPRKSILVLDSMVGWHRYTGRPIDKRLLADVLYESNGVNIAFRVDAAKIKAQLDKKVFAQDLATSVVARRLQLCVADLNDKGRPMANFLFTGSTGVGKATSADTEIPVYSEDGSISWKKAGLLEPGDTTFGREGLPQAVLGVFPQGLRDMYRVTLWDGRTIDVDGDHIWPVYTSKMRSNKHAGKNVAHRLMTTREMIEKGVVRSYAGDSREHLKFFIPANDAVQWPARELEVDPYVLGVLIGNGCLTIPALTLSSDDAHTVMRVADWLGCAPKSGGKDNFNWTFGTGQSRGNQGKERVVQTRDVLGSVPDLIGSRSPERRIPQEYLTSSVEQRWELVNGLFDTDGHIGGRGGRYNVSFSTASEGLAEDVRRLLFSLGVSNTVTVSTRERDGRTLVEHRVHCKVPNEHKERFFSLPRKRAIAREAVSSTTARDRVKKFDMVGISSIEQLPEQQEAVCIYVDHDEHLYQAGEFIVTHNTELSKQLAQLLFGDAQRHMIRFDMTEYSQDASVDSFKDELTSRVWQTPFSVILLDEIEKASSAVTRILLQVLDDGRMSDRNGRQVSFLNAYIVLTTNAGSEIFETIGHYASSDEGSGKEIVKYEKLIRRSISTTTGHNRFPPELLGRVDAIVPFQPLSRRTQESIIMAKLAALHTDLMTKHDVKLAVDKKVVQYLVEDRGESDASAGGARAAISRLNDEVVTEIATFVNTYPRERAIKVNIEGKLVSDDKSILESDAHVIVTAHR